MLTRHLHTFGRHPPERGRPIEILELLPTGMTRLIGPRPSQQREQQGSPSHRATPRRVIAIIAINRPNELWEFARSNTRHMPRAGLGLEQLFEMLGGITLCPALRNRKAIDLPGILLEPPADIERRVPRRAGPSPAHRTA